MKKYWIAGLAVAAVIGVADFVLHTIVLKDLYSETMFLWRTEEEIRGMSWLMWAGYLAFSLVFVLIYGIGFEAGKPALSQGLRYGFWVGLLLSVPMATACYAVMPIPVMMSVWWFVGGMVECVLAGIVASAIYRPEKK